MPPVNPAERSGGGEVVGYPRKEGLRELLMQAKKILSLVWRYYTGKKLLIVILAHLAVGNGL